MGTETWVELVLQRGKRKATKVKALRCALCATIYLVWQARNFMKFRQPTSASSIVYRVKFIVCNRLQKLVGDDDLYSFV